MDRPESGGQRQGGGLDPAGIVSWESASLDTLDKASRDGKPLFIFFPGEDEKYNSDSYFYGKDLRDLADNEAVFVRVPYNGDREPLPDAELSPVPMPKLASDNPSRDYAVKSYPTFIVADSYGNEVFRLGKNPKAGDLEKYFGEVSSRMDKTHDRLRKNLDKARQAVEKGDTKGALSKILGNFKEDVVGLEAQEETIRLYHEILDGARSQAAELASAGDDESLRKLKEMKKLFRNTELETEIQDLLDGNKN